MYTILQAKKSMREGIGTYLEKDEDGNYLLDEVNCLPFYLEGPPGIGKTQIVRQLADEMKLGYVSISLVHHTRNSLLGLPVITELENGDKYTAYTMSEVIAEVYREVEKGHEEGILLLDEFPCMSDMVMPTMLAFLQTKNIGFHSLPRGWVLVLCGNPAKYNKSSHSFDAAVTDRIRKIEIKYDVKDFISYANEIGLSPYITDYLAIYPSHVYRFVNDKNNSELVTCRSWENLSHALTISEKINNDIDEGLFGQFIKSDEIVGSFSFFYRSQILGIDLEETKSILRGNFSSSLRDRLKDLPLHKKWVICKYLTSFLDKDIRRIEEIMKNIGFAKCVSDRIKLELATSKDISENSAWSISELLVDILEQNNFGFAVRSVNYDSVSKQIMKELAPTLALSNINMENFSPNKAINEWVAFNLSSSYGDVDLLNACVLKEFTVRLSKWCDGLAEKQGELVGEMGEAIENILNFLKEIDSTESLCERFYLEVCNNSELLKASYMVGSEAFVHMCRKHYGLETA